jgi:long-chain acyl-CoA synthetase
LSPTRARPRRPAQDDRSRAPTLFSGVPALFIALLNHPKVKNQSVDFSSIRACFSGACSLVGGDKNAVRGTHGGRIVEGYSLTESDDGLRREPAERRQQSGLSACVATTWKSRLSTRTRAADFFRPAKPARVILRAPQLMTRYFNNVEETARALRDHPTPLSGTGPERPLGFTLGTWGTSTRTPFCFIVDRQKDLIKTSGYQVWPRESKKCSPHIPRQDVASPACPTMSKARS